MVGRKGRHYCGYRIVETQWQGDWRSSIENVFEAMAVGRFKQEHPDKDWELRLGTHTLEGNGGTAGCVEVREKKGVDWQGKRLRTKE